MSIEYAALRNSLKIKISNSTRRTKFIKRNVEVRSFEACKGTARMKLHF